MADLQKIVKVTQAQYDTLAGGGTVGSYTGLDDNYIYLVEDNSTSSSLYLHTLTGRSMKTLYIINNSSTSLGNSISDSLTVYGAMTSAVRSYIYEGTSTSIGSPYCDIISYKATPANPLHSSVAKLRIVYYSVSNSQVTDEEISFIGDYSDSVTAL